MDIEALAVSKISSMLARCAHLKAFVETNDRTPFTDGYVDLYSGLKQSKEYFEGRVSVQVKGRSGHTRRGTPFAHSIARSDLLAYQKDSGVLYFVVIIDSKSSKRTPCYALLSPFAIEAILGEVPQEQKSVAVQMKKFPDDPTSIERIVGLALQTRKQNMSLGFDPVLFDHLASLTVHTSSAMNLEVPLTLAPGKSDFALVLNTKDGLSVPYPGGIEILPAGYAERRVDLQVRTGGITYEGAIARKIEEDYIELELSEGLKMLLRLGLGGQSGTVSLSLEKTLVGRLKALQFYAALLDTNAIEFNGSSSPFKVTASDEDPWLLRHIKNLEALASLLDSLGVDINLVEPDQIDEVQMRHLNVLHRAFVRNEEIADKSLSTGRVRQSIGQWSIMFLVAPGSAPGKWRFIDLFSETSRSQFRLSTDGDGVQKGIPITAYDVVEDEHLATVINMRLGSIVRAYEAIAELPTTCTIANQRVLALITAADAGGPRSNELLKAASDLNDWLMMEQPEEFHHLLNHWQILARQRRLSAEHRSEVRKLRRQLSRSSADDASQMEAACALLLGDEEDVEDVLLQLSQERLLQLQAWPIWHLRSLQKDSAKAAGD